MKLQQRILTCLCFALLAAPFGAAAQSNITLSTPETLQFNIRVSIAPGTQQVYCYQEDKLTLIGTKIITSGSQVFVPVSLPDPVIRCTACNSSGCSTLSSNAAVVLAADPLDLDLNGVVNVTDIVMCSSKIRDAIY